MHAVFKGNVQGVGFRYQTKACALALKLTGTVRNLPNGDVELIAQGEKAALQSLVDQLENEMFKGMVREKKLSFRPAEGKFSTFKITG